MTGRRRPTAVLALAAVVLLVSSCEVQAPPLTDAERSQCRVAALGDSLTVGVQPYLAGALSERGCTLAWIDAKVSRRTGEGVDVLVARALADDVPPVLIVGLGTNDRYELDRFVDRVDRVMRIANGRQVVWIDNAYPPVRDRVNAILADRARRHGNLTVMRWNHLYWVNPSWRAADQVHATPTGYRARANLMAGAAADVVK